jgi:hypothetical protein
MGHNSPLTKQLPLLLLQCQGQMCPKVEKHEDVGLLEMEIKQFVN